MRSTATLVRPTPTPDDTGFFDCRGQWQPLGTPADAQKAVSC